MKILTFLLLLITTFCKAQISEPIILKSSIIGYKDKALSTGQMISKGDTIYYTPSDSKVLQITHKGKSLYTTKGDIEQAKGLTALAVKAQDTNVSINGGIPKYNDAGKLIKDGATAMIAGVIIAGLGSYLGAEADSNEIILGASLLGIGINVYGLSKIAKGGSLLQK